MVTHLNPLSPPFWWSLWTLASHPHHAYLPNSLPVNKLACTVADSAVYLLKWRVSVCFEGQGHERLSNAFWFDIYTFNHQQCLSLSTRNPSTRHMTLDWPSECCSYCPSLRQCSQNTPTELEVQDNGGLAAAWPARSRQRSHSHRSTQLPVLRHPSANINIKVTNKLQRLQRTTALHAPWCECTLFKRRHALNRAQMDT